MPQLKKKNVVPLVIDIVPDLAGLDHYDNMSPELTAIISGKVMENKPDSLYYIELPAAMMSYAPRRESFLQAGIPHGQGHIGGKSYSLTLLLPILHALLQERNSEVIHPQFSTPGGAA